MMGPGPHLDRRTFVLTALAALRLLVLPTPAPPRGTEVTITARPVVAYGHAFGAAGPQALQE